MDTATALARTIAWTRIAIGIGLVAAPSQVGGRWIGRTAHGADAQIALRGLGIRDVALGAATLGTLRATGSGGTGFKVLTGLSVAVDVTDTVTTLSAGEQVPDARRSAAVAALGAVMGTAVLALSRDG